MTALAIAEDYEPEPDAPDVRAIARQLIEEHGNNAAALSALVERADEDNALYKAIVNGHFRPMCAEVIRRATQESRAGSWSPPAARPSNPIDLAAWNEAVSDGLMDFRIEGGKRLRDATRPELLASAAAFETRGFDQLIKGRWQRLAAQAINDDTTPAGRALTEDRLAELKAEAKKIRGVV